MLGVFKIGTFLFFSILGVNALCSLSLSSHSLLFSPSPPLLLCDVDLAFLNEIAMQFIFLFLELVPAIDFVKSPHLKVMVLIIFKMELR